MTSTTLRSGTSRTPASPGRMGTARSTTGINYNIDQQVDFLFTQVTLLDLITHKKILVQ